MDLKDISLTKGTTKIPAYVCGHCGLQTLLASRKISGWDQHIERYLGTEILPIACRGPALQPNPKFPPQGWGHHCDS